VSEARERFCLVASGPPRAGAETYRDEVRRLLRAACEARRIAFEEVDAALFDYAPERALRAGDMLYCTTALPAAARVEQFLVGPGVGTFYADPRRVFFNHTNQPLLFERAGLPIPASVSCTSKERSLVDVWCARAGGFPLLAKMGGFAGNGVVMIESRAALYSFVDYAHAIGRVPTLCAYVDGAEAWRVIVVGDRAVAAYRCIAREGDFRATEPDPDGPFLAEVPSKAGRLAIAAVAAMGLEFGGVDLLLRVDEHYVLESNFPCYFPHAQVLGGIDVAGAMIDHLRLKAQAVRSS
jgi:hypothetical protein